MNYKPKAKRLITALQNIIFEPQVQLIDL